MSQKGKQICMNALVISLMFAIVLMVGLGRATSTTYYQDDLEGLAAMCNDIDMDGFVVDEADMPADWDGIMSMDCDWIIGWGDCDNYDMDTFPGAIDPTGDGIDQNCDGIDGDNPAIENLVYPIGEPSLELPEPDPYCNYNGICEAGENSTNCLVDCLAVPTDPICGDGVCDADEDSTNCVTDCPLPAPCNNDGVCDADENYYGCPNDCSLLEDPGY